MQKGGLCFGFKGRMPDWGGPNNKGKGRPGLEGSVKSKKRVVLQKGGKWLWCTTFKMRKDMAHRKHYEMGS